MLASWKVAPALAFGNTVVLKPAEQSPLTAARLGELALEAGLPPGVLNVVHGFGPDGAGEALTRDPPRGPHHVHRRERDRAGDHGRRRRATSRPVSFELGGKSANVVFDDADLDAALDGALRGDLHEQRRDVPGRARGCSSSARSPTSSPSASSRRRRALRVGDPKDPATEVGPLVERAHWEKVRRLRRARPARRAARVLTGGGPPGRPAAAGRRHYYAPTVLGGHAQRHAHRRRRRSSGRCRPSCAFDDEDEALAIANASRYGLAGMVWTRDLDRAHRMAARWRTGTVWVNCFFVRDLRAAVRRRAPERHRPRGRRATRASSSPSRAPS